MINGRPAENSYLTYFKPKNSLQNTDSRSFAASTSGLVSVELPLAENCVLNGVDVLSRYPVDPVPGLLRGSELQGQDVVVLVALDGLAHDALDRVQEDLLRSFLCADPKLEFLKSRE